MTHNLTRHSTEDDVHGGELPASRDSRQSNEDYNLRYVTACSLVERWWCKRNISATIWVEDEGIRLVSNNTSLPDYMVLHSTRSSSSHTFLPNSNHSGSHKTMYRDNGCVVRLHNLEWHFDSAACKIKYNIFSFLMAVLWAGQSGNRIQWGQYILLLSKLSMRPTQPPIQRVWGLFRRGKSSGVSH
jgi:hypothetical protein